jgi:deoxyadenosine/deoxycytidine kinase
MHIAIAGNIGSGKSTLTELLARHYGWEARYEAVEHNPYLEDYYRDIHRWAFNLEIYFLKERFRDLIAIAEADHDIIQDRTIYEGVYVFMTNNYEMGNLSERDYHTYMELFEQMMGLVRVPDLMIYIRSSIPTLVEQIQKRGREYEQTMRLDYLQGLQKRYEDWISTYKGQLIIIDGDTCKFGENPSHLKQVTDMIDAKLYGLFPME